MRFLSVLIVLLFAASCCMAQQKLVTSIISHEKKEPVSASIRIKGINKGFSTDTLGITTLEFPANGNYTLVVSAVDHEESVLHITIPFEKDSLLIEMKINDEEMEEVIVQSTRTSRTIANVPTRVETIELEEIDEKNNMRPGNVAMLLHESTGIQVQQTSATSGNASVRMQGLDGRYTQLLKDGFANFGNFSSGLSVLEIPPLDLKQVEIIKGPASPLFGGGAIAGVVNFISKTPKEKAEYSFILNHSNISQSNIGAFISQKKNKAGFTLLALYSRQKEYDVDKDDFTEVPESKEFTIHPKLFLYPDDKTTLIIGNSFSKAERTGGDVFVIKNKADALHQYFEKNKSLRNISSFELDKKMSERNTFIFKQSFSIFDRSIEIPAYTFSGIAQNAFSDVSFIINRNKHALVLGANFIYDHFNEKDKSSSNRDNTTTTSGLYVQHTWDANEKIKLESGLRIDMVNNKNSLYKKSEVFILPRMSLLIRYNTQLSSRIGAGMGYKTPTLFTEETETMQYRFVNQLKDVRSEKSYGATADINFRTSLADDLSFSFNHMFYFTVIEKPLVLVTSMAGLSTFMNAVKPLQTAGFETNAKFIYKENFKLFLGYTFTDARAKYLSGNQFITRVPKHKLNSALIYEKEGNLKLGLEGYFTGKQYLSNNTQSPAYSEFGFMAEKIFRHFSVYINFENFTDTRQSRYKNVVNGSHLNPTFDEIWTHTEGFVLNGGVKIRL